MEHLIPINISFIQKALEDRLNMPKLCPVTKRNNFGERCDGH